MASLFIITLLLIGVPLGINGLASIAPLEKNNPSTNSSSGTDISYSETSINSTNNTPEPTTNYTPEPTTNYTPEPTISVSPGLSLFSDPSCTKSIANLNWGSLYPGDSETNAVYIKNVGSSPITLNLKTTNWSPSSIHDLLSISWDREGFVLSPGQSVGSALTLTVNSAAQGISSFTVDITISGHD